MLQLPDTYDLSPSRAAPGAMLSDPDAIILLFAGHALVQRSDGPPAPTPPPLWRGGPLLVGYVELTGYVSNSSRHLITCCWWRRQHQRASNDYQHTHQV